MHCAGVPAQEGVPAGGGGAWPGVFAQGGASQHAMGQGVYPSIQLVRGCGEGGCGGGELLVWPSGVALWSAFLLLWPSVVTFYYALLLWPSGLHICDGLLL